MESVVIDKKEVKEQYTSNGNKKTRIHTIRAMNNNGSEFVNYKCGRNSVNISKGAIKEITDTMNKLNWKASKTDNTSDDNKLLEHIKQLQKQINALKDGK